MAVFIGGRSLLLADSIEAQTNLVEQKTKLDAELAATKTELKWACR